MDTLKTNLIDDNVIKSLNEIYDMPQAEEVNWIFPFQYIYTNIIKTHFFYFVWFLIVIGFLLYRFFNKNKKTKKIKKTSKINVKPKINYEPIELQQESSEDNEELSNIFVDELDERNGTRDLTKMYHEIIGE